MFKQAIRLVRVHYILFSLFTFLPGLAILVGLSAHYWPGESKCAWPFYLFLGAAPFGLSILVYPLLIIISLVLWIYNRKPFWLVSTCASVVGFLFVFGGAALHGHFQNLALVGVAERGNQIILAIENFRKVTGQLPSQITDLKPGYLSSIPQTGICMDPDFKYSYGEYKKDFSLQVDIGFFLTTFMYSSKGPIDENSVKIGKWEILSD